jgi:serine/threonine-protein kinase
MSRSLHAREAAAWLGAAVLFSSTAPCGCGDAGTSAVALQSGGDGAGTGAPTGSGGTTGTTTGGATATGGSAGGTVPPGSLFEKPNPWTKDVSALPKSDASDAIIGWLAANGGFGGGRLRIDFSLEVLSADASTPRRAFAPTADFYSPDCDLVPFPVPPGGALEGEQGYACTQDGDCHLLVVDRSAKRLYEMWRADLRGDVFKGGCAAVWDLGRSYPESLRGEGCTSADAGGFPIAAMLFSADEVASGTIGHAIRFILPNQRIRHALYVRPATHSTASTSGGPNAPPYGVRLRLRAGFPMAKLPAGGAHVVAEALQRYGMLLADGGTIALTAQSDRNTARKWAEVGVGAGSLQAITPSDFEVVDMGAPVPLGDCARNF